MIWSVGVYLQCDGVEIVGVWVWSKFQPNIYFDFKEICCTVSLFVSVCILNLLYVYYCVIIIIVSLTNFIFWLHFRVLPTLDRVFLEDNWLFFLLSLVAVVEGLANVIVLGWVGNFLVFHYHVLIICFCGVYLFFRIWWICLLTLWIYLHLIGASFCWF